MPDYPTLDEISQMPEGQDELAQHLYARGYATPPQPPPEPAPLIPDANVATPMTPPDMYAGAHDRTFAIPRHGGEPSGAAPDLGTVSPVTANANRPAIGTLGPVKAAKESPWDLSPSASSAPNAPRAAAPVAGAEMVPPEIGGMGAGGATPAIPTPAPPLTLRKPTKQESKEAGQEERKLNIAQYYRERPQITAAPGTVDYNNQVQAQAVYDKKHPLGAPISRMPGTKGKILHDLAMAGEIGGYMVSPQLTSQIPGTRPFLNLRQHAAEAEAERLRPQELAAENAPYLRANIEAETGLRGAEQAAKEKQTELAGIPQDEVGYQVRNLMTSGAGGGPQINPDTKKPFTQFEAYRAVKQAGEKLPEADKPLGADAESQAAAVAQSNAGFTQRYQVMHPNTQPPAWAQVAPNATRADYARTHAALESEENALKGKEQMDFQEKMRRMAEADKKDQMQEKKEKEGRDWVTGEDPNTHEQVMVPLQQAKDLGLLDQAKADTDTINKTISARHVLPLLYHNDPADLGIVQMIDSLNKKGKLGALAGRWNDFIGRKWGEGDPEYMALRARMDLATTKLMQAHVGSRGGSYMLEHFEDIANAGKMDAASLLAGVNQELHYVKELAQLPPSRLKGTPTAGGATGPKAGASPYKKGDVSGGYEFQGGDWHDKKQWKKVEKK